MAGRTCSKFPASVRRAPRHKPMRLRVRAGKAVSRPVSRNTNRRRASFGYSGASTAPEHRRTMPQFTSGTVDPSIDMKTAVREQVYRMDTVSYFTLLAQLMKANPPATADAPELAKFAKIGLVA